MNDEKKIAISTIFMLLAKKNKDSGKRNFMKKLRKCQNWFRHFKEDDNNHNDNSKSKKPSAVEDEDLLKII